MAVVVAVGWRLASGPVDVPALIPHLERALSRPDGRIVTRIGGSQIAWDTRQHEIDLIVRDLRVLEGDEQLLHLPVASLEFSGRELLLGRLVLRAVELPGPRVTLRRDADGTVRAGVVDEAGAAPPTKLIPELLAPRPGDPVSSLQRVEVSDGEVTMLAPDGRPAWRMTGADLVLARAPGAVAIDGACRLTVGATMMPVRIDGTVATAGAPTFTASVDAGSVAPRDLLPFWPVSTAPALRAWLVEHVRGARAHDVRLSVGGRVTDDGGIAVDAIDGSFAFSDLVLQPSDDVPPVTGMAGRAIFDRSRWRFQVARGQSAGVDVADGSVEIATAESTSLSVRAAVRGPIERALPLLRQYAGNQVLPGMTATGRIDASLTAGVPGGKSFDWRRDLVARGRLQNLASPDLVGRRPLTGGELTFELARQVFTARGTAVLSGVPGDVTLRTPIGGGASEVQAKARLDAAGRAAFGLDAGAWLTGLTPVDAKVMLSAAPSATMTVSADLREARFSLPALGMEKPSGVAGTASAMLRLAGGNVQRIDDAVLRYGATQLRGHAGFDGTTIASLDLRGTLGPVPGRKTPSSIMLRIAPGAPRRSITATTDDVDLLFRAMGMAADAEGGTLRFTGTLAPAPAGGVEGQAEARDFALASAPGLARLLSAASLPGVGDLFAGRGLPVTRLAATIAYAPPRITLTDGVLESPSLGMRLAGTIDTGGAIACKGTLVPSYYGVNRMARHIPVLGRVFTGSKGEGLQVFDFDIRGTTAAPRITVDPLASLAPGAMRDLIKLLPRPHVPVRP